MVLFSFKKLEPNRLSVFRASTVSLTHTAQKADKQQTKQTG